MRDVIAALESCAQAGGTFALATVVGVANSAPRPQGATMVITRDEVFGSVSGGCVEGAVFEVAQQVMDDGHPQMQRFGYSDDDAFAVGLTCGGSIDIFIERMSVTTFPQLGVLVSMLKADEPVALVTVIEHIDPDWIGRKVVVSPTDAWGSLGSPTVTSTVVDDARGLLAAGTTTDLTYGPGAERMDTGMRVFVASHQPRPRLIIFGAIDFAASLAKAGRMIGFHVTVCDARPLFATKMRFPDADEVVVSWPHRYLEQEAASDRIDNRTAVCVLTHDAKFDVPALSAALALSGRHRLAYVGAMGSRRTHTERLQRLQNAGVSAAQLEPLRSPIGLDLGGRTSDETAVSIVAEIIAVRSGGTGRPLRDSDSFIHSHR
ncbi:MAG TPA: XdhC/CoxI family protein [Microbacterium sp.]|uniref:XdhC/CoxI family protein n=1 Tax=Microbacterium sp. TaxID=51671 RepID=UPI002C676703|nr:XdhC/CoxI family protein [Microbacterium sp.]HWI32179.1 XdhC/CoxI family protein [Microbacterium sp.]